ncbi:DUF2336 domain-containing protein [Falsiroseomonas selenitidurans]|uniref:DUF2336 domain-containing protein n=1 Tax=Falsiroseomonas selenitidurans TaxID=2716335 RepID=A0ABX1E440_9PROT|nr:DUF2336 domain-containing protein [Falsiroseomonas selenitidurans]NKC29695.1 DUF2336 domain-containing protein [Falsiroseomonas selenitidurans]
MTDTAATIQAARHGDAAARAAVARGTTTSPELLTFLAADRAAEVRQAVAANAGTPPAAARLLASDADAAVRRVLARRIAALAPSLGPGLGPGAQDRMARISAGTLAMLVEDAAVEVRAAIAAVVRDMPDAPRALILRLARDTAMPVAEPVIRLSPLLSDADLLALIADPPAPATRRAVARRPALSEVLSDAIVETTDTPAIAALLANPSAAIREATLDRLVENAGNHSSWQAALVRRARLPAGAARALGEMVADHLLGVLAARPDLPPGLAETLRGRVTARMAQPDDARAEAALFAAARAGDRGLLTEHLAEAAGVTVARVEAALALRSGRAIAGLCHSAGWSAALAAEVQAVLGGLSPAEVVRPTAEGGWSLGEAELQWQAELLEGLPA